MHANTLCGLQHWYEQVFEKLGWMVLAKEKGMDYKITAYTKSINHLVAAIDHVSMEYHDADKIHDLHVLHMNTVCLQAFVKKCF